MDESNRVEFFMADITSLRANATPAMKWMNDYVQESIRLANRAIYNLANYGNIDKGKAPGVRG